MYFFSYRFLNLDASALQDKWFGESQKLVGAVFSLAKKLQPCIVFIDEIDALLRSRNSQDHEANGMIKAQFMQLWDGMLSDAGCVVVVMGATNRPRDVDPAILRRMPATFHVGLPEKGQRREILKQILKVESVSEDVDLDRLAALTDGFSGSDLRELCRTASVYRLKDFEGGKNVPSQLRHLTIDDLLAALRKMKESKTYCGGGLMRPLGVD